VVLAFAGLVMGIDLYVWNAKTVVGNALPMPFGFGLAVVSVDSMEPTLSEDDLVLVRAANQVSADDVLVYQQGRQLVICQVKAVDGKTVYTLEEGGTEKPVDVTAVKGVLVGRVPHMGKVLRFLRSSKGAVLVLLAALLLTEGSFRIQRARDNARLEELRTEIRRLRREK
jgi:hypothetical protein